MANIIRKINEFLKMADQTDDRAQQISAIFANFNINIPPNTFSIMEVSELFGTVLQISFQIKESEFSNFWFRRTEIQARVESTLKTNIKFNPVRVRD